MPAVLDVKDGLGGHDWASEVVLHCSKSEGEKAEVSPHCPTRPEPKSQLINPPVELGDNVVDGHDAGIDSAEAFDEVLDDLDLAV
jgi:hypothetical protein